MINPWSSADLAMKVLENSMATWRMSDALLIDSLAMILITQRGMTRPAETEIWEPFYWLKGRQLTWSNVTFWRMNDAVGMRILLFLTKDLSILTLKMLESITIPMIPVGNGCYYREWKSWRRTVFHLLTDKTARSLYYSSTMLASWEKGWQSINWVRSFVVLLLDYSGMKYSWRHSSQELRLQGGTVGVVSPPLSLLLLPSTRFFYAPPLSSEKSLPPQSLPILLASLVRSMFILSLLLEVMMLNYLPDKYNITSSVDSYSQVQMWPR